MSVEKITLDKVRQANIIDSFHITDVYRSDTTRELDKIYDFNGTPRSVNHVHSYMLGYEKAQVELVLPVFIKLAGVVGYFCGIRMDEVPQNRKEMVGITVSQGWLQRYEHDDATVVEPSMKVANEDVGITRKREPTF